jgi:hypothetical protein
VQATPASSEGPAARRSLRPRIAAVVALLTPVVMAIVAAVALAGDLAIAALAPDGAVGLAPGARAAALTADNLGALLRVAVGK